LPSSRRVTAKVSQNPNFECYDPLSPKVQPDGSYITVRIGKYVIDALVDSGAMTTLISERAAKFLKLQIESISSSASASLVSATGTSLELIGYTTAELYFKCLQLEHRIGVVKQLTPAFLLGTDFLVANVANLDYTVKPPVLRLFDNLIEMPMSTRCDETNSVTVAQTICIPAYNEAYLPVNSPPEFNHKDIQLKRLSRVTCVSVANALTSCKNNKTICRVLNHNPYVVTLKKGMKIAKIVGLDKIIAPIGQCTKPEASDQQPVANVRMSRTKLDDFHKSYGFELCPDLDEERRYQVLEMLYRYKTVFARDLSEIKECKGEPLRLALHTDRKMFKRQFRLSEPDNVELARQIKQMEDE